ncbi:MAG TPA: NAD(P)H-hydrate epimerase [Candidatus Dormibacteraeota bacterium]
MSWPAISSALVPVAPAELMRRVDLEAQQQFQIGTAQLMEIAGFQVARFIGGWLGEVSGRRVAVLAGPGNNGGDALVAARFLAQRGALVECLCLPPKDPSSLAANHAGTLRSMGIDCRPFTSSTQLSADLIVDGLLGTGVHLPLRQPYPGIIADINRARSQVVAIDLPSGLDSDTAEGDSEAVQATATLTLGLPKPALSSAQCCGRLFLADIGLPAALFGADEQAVRALYKKGDLLEVLRSAQTAS